MLPQWTNPNETKQKSICQFFKLHRKQHRLNLKHQLCACEELNSTRIYKHFFFSKIYTMYTLKEERKCDVTLTGFLHNCPRVFFIFFYLVLKKISSRHLFPISLSFEWALAENASGRDSLNWPWLKKQNDPSRPPQNSIGQYNFIVSTHDLCFVSLFFWFPPEIWM